MDESELYLNKFKNKYFIKVDEDKVRVIQGKLGKIGVYDLKNQFLGVWCINLSKRKKTELLKQLSPYLIDVHQDCDNEFGAYFHEKSLDFICNKIKVRKKRQLNNEQRTNLANRAKKNFSKKQFLIQNK